MHVSAIHRHSCVLCIAFNLFIDSKFIKTHQRKTIHEQEDYSAWLEEQAGYLEEEGDDWGDDDDDWGDDDW